MKNIDTLFVCKANVGRSQIAEGFYNYYFDNKSISLAGVEARKEIYNGKPYDKIVDLMKNNKNIDISNQNINYITDFSLDILKGIDRIIFLYDPIKDSKDNVDESCKIEGIIPYNYFKNVLFKDVLIYNIEDPFEQSSNSIIDIMNEIEFFVKKL